VSTGLSLFEFFELLVSCHFTVLHSSWAVELYFGCSWSEIATGQRMPRIFLSLPGDRCRYPLAGRLRGGVKRQYESRAKVKITVSTPDGS
jgi:hypothetical protein